MKRAIQYFIATSLFLLLSFYIVFCFHFENAGLEFIKLTSVLILIFVVICKHITWLVSDNWRNNGNV